jgi:hypothetical protein
MTNRVQIFHRTESQKWIKEETNSMNGPRMIAHASLCSGQIAC